ncbi:MAG: hypothetical protein MK033_04025 [Candidatus Caenarcaniphilales bacterium]|nr:hypothetical protein [Candidatus Caenarcaniphilales bacterium]
MQVNNKLSNIQKQIRQIKKRYIAGLLKDPAQSKLVSKNEINDVTGFNSNVAPIPSRVYLDTLLTVFAHAEEKHADSSTAKLCTKTLSKLFKARNVIASSFIDLLCSSPAFIKNLDPRAMKVPGMSDEIMDLLNELQRNDKLDLLNFNIEKLSQLSPEERLAEDITENLKLIRAANKVLNSVIESELVDIWNKDSALPKNINGFRESLTNIDKKFTTCSHLIGDLMGTGLDFIRSAPEISSTNKSNSISKELHKRGACDLVDDIIKEFYKTLRLTAGRPIKREDLKITASLLRNVNNVYARFLQLKNI